MQDTSQQLVAWGERTQTKARRQPKGRENTAAVTLWRRPTRKQWPLCQPPHDEPIHYTSWRHWFSREGLNKRNRKTVRYQMEIGKSPRTLQRTANFLHTHHLKHTFSLQSPRNCPTRPTPLYPQDSDCAMTIDAKQATTIPTSEMDNMAKKGDLRRKNKMQLWKTPR